MILAVALVAVLGITALAIDGSIIYQERRNDQTTADSTALSAAQTASANATCATARVAAINQAIAYASAQEGIALANDTTSPNRV
ncbi:MAG: pilus assembly protein TadG-related protein, partial [Anaerolineaceae bacterium]